MAVRSGARGGFLETLDRTYLLVLVAAVAIFILLGVLEQFGVPNRWVGSGVVVLTIALYAAIGVMSRTADVDEFYLAGRSVPPVYNGMAAAANWLSGASFLAMAGTLMLLGYDGLAFVLGWSGGFVLVAVLIAPYLRKSGARTVPEFFAARYGGGLARVLAVAVLIGCSFAYLVAQIYACGLIASRFFELDFTIAVYAGVVAILLCSILGGMKSVTWTQVAQYTVLAVAYLTPVVLLSAKTYGIPLPQLTYGQALAEITSLESSLLGKGLANAKTLKPHIKPFTTFDPLNYFALIFCLMVGTASLPHVLMRAVTTPSVRDTRSSVAWSAFFIFLLYVTAPAYAAFAKLELFTLINKGTRLTDLPAWMFAYGKLGLVQVCGVDVVAVQEVVEACAKLPRHQGLLRWQDLSINPDVVVLSMPEIAGLPYVVVALVAAGGLAATMATASGLLLASANSLSHDIVTRAVGPHAGAGTRLLVSRILLFALAVASAYVATTRPADILSMVAWAFSVAAAGLFPALVLGIWWKRANAPGAILGMVVGVAVCLYYLVGTRYFAVSFHETWQWLGTASPPALSKFAALKKAYLAAAPGAAQDAAWLALDKHAQAIASWWGVRNLSSGLFGVPVGLLTIVVISLLTPRPGQPVEDFVDATRVPSGDPVLDDRLAEPGRR